MPETPPPSSSMMLVVDDEEIMQEVMRDILAEMGYNVDVEKNGKDGLEAVEKKDYDLVFADVRMPKMDGIEFLKNTKRIKPNLDVIMMTGYASVDVAVEAMKLGAIDFITKPFNLEHIKVVTLRAMETRVLKKKAEEGEYYKRLSLTDGLTELFNHRYFHQLLEIEVSRSTRKGCTFCVLMIDVDDFKVYNDTLGHTQGDYALRFLAWLVRHHARREDMVCRYGGDEFTIILAETDQQNGRLAAQRFLRIIEETEFEKQEVLPNRNMTVSIGLACFPDDASSAEEVLKKADEAMYQAKSEGKNKLVCWAEMGKNEEEKPHADS